jgi:hypothetical protein
MHEKFIVYLLLFFLPVSTCFAELIQSQGYGIGGDNIVILAGGPAGAAQNTNVAVIGQNQQSGSPYSPVKLMQSENAMLVQSANAVGLDGAFFGVGQNAAVLGGQSQTAIGGQTMQNQYLNSLFAQDAVSDGGIGAAVGIQSFVGLDAQLMISVYGASANVNCLGLTQVNTAGGEP